MGLSKYQALEYSKIPLVHYQCVKTEISIDAELSDILD